MSSSATPSSSPETSPGGRPRSALLRREWKGERGRPVFILQFGHGYRARQTLRELLLETADRGGGPLADKTGVFRALRALVEAGGVGSRESLHAEIGYQAWDDALPFLAAARIVRPLDPANVAHGAAWRTNPRIAAQIAPAANKLFEEWKPVTKRSWADGALRLERGGEPAETISLKNAAARIFHASGAWEPGQERRLLWLSCLKLAADPKALLPVSKASARAAKALEPLGYYGLAEANDDGDWSLSPDAPAEAFAAAVEEFAPFAGAGEP